MRPPRRPQATPGLRDHLDGRPSKGSVAVDEDWQGRIDQPAVLEQAIGLGRTRLVPLVRLRAAREEVAKTVVLGVHPPATTSTVARTELTPSSVVCAGRAR